MAARTFTMPTSLNQKLASHPKPSLSNSDERSPPGSGQSTSLSQKESRSYQDSKARPGVTFAAQDKLPKLPIPDLESTCEKYLDALKCLQSHREHKNTIAAVEDFLKRDGPELHQRLKKYATGKTSYIEQFCQYASGSYDKRRSNKYP